VGFYIIWTLAILNGHLFPIPLANLTLIKWLEKYLIFMSKVFKMLDATHVQFTKQSCICQMFKKT
jgi:hypothetical protein